MLETCEPAKHLLVRGQTNVWQLSFHVQKTIRSNVADQKVHSGCLVCLHAHVSVSVDVSVDTAAKVGATGGRCFEAMGMRPPV